MKKSQYFIFFVMVVMLSLGLWFFINRPGPTDGDLLITFKNVDKVKVGEKVQPISLVASSSSTNILYPKIDTSSPGKRILTYIIVGEHGKQKEFMLELDVVDPKPPILELKSDVVKIDVDDKFNPLDYVKESMDQFDGKLAVNIDGKYDVKLPGKYSLVYWIKNSSDNKVTKKLSLFVEQKKESKPIVERIPPSNEIHSENESNGNKTPTTPQKPPTSNENSSESNGNNTQREFLVKNYASFDETLSACRVAGQGSGRTWNCVGIKGANGIYTGYQLSFN